MGMMYKQMSEKLPGSKNGYELSSKISSLNTKCQKGLATNCEIPINLGNVKINHSIFARGGAFEQAELNLDDSQLANLIMYPTRLLHKDFFDDNTTTMSFYFTKKVDSSQYLSERTGEIMNVPVAISIYPGTVEKDYNNFVINKKNWYRKLEKKVDGKISEENEPSLVMEVGLNTEKLDCLNGSYAVKKGIDPERHKKGIMIADVAESELGFKYKERHDPNGTCFSQICVCPREVLAKEFPIVAVEYSNKDIFEEMVLNSSKESGFLNFSGGNFDFELKTPSKGSHRIRAESQNMDLLEDMFENDIFSISAGSEIKYSEYSGPKMEKALEIGAYGLGIALSSLVMGASGIAFAGRKIGGSIENVKREIARRHHEKHRTELVRIRYENRLIEKMLKDDGVKSNFDSSESHPIYLDRKRCITEAMEKYKDNL